MADKLNYIIEGTQVNAESITVPSDSPYKVLTVHDHIKKDEVSSVEIWENNNKSGTQLIEEAYTGTVSGTGKFQIDYEGVEETTGIKRCSTVLFHSAQAGTSWYIWYKSTGDEAEAGDINGKADKDTDAIEGNLAEFDANGNPVDSGIASNTVPIATTADLTFYVNPATGSDENDGSSGSPFATIAKAISLIPRIVNHTVTINLADGSYSEGITLTGYMGGGEIYILGNGDYPENVVIAGRIYAVGCSVGFIVLYGMETTNTGSDGIYLACCSSYFTIDHVLCDTTDAINDGFYAIGCPTVYIKSSTFSNRWRGISAIDGTTVISASNDGANNDIGLYAKGSTIMKDGTQPGGTTNEIAVSGGQIISSRLADRDEDAVEGNIAVFDSVGNPVDSGKSFADVGGGGGVGELLFLYSNYSGGL